MGKGRGVTDPMDELPAEAIVSQALMQMSDAVQAWHETALAEPNARNNALLSSMAMVGFVPNILGSDYVEAQKCLAEMMAALFGALGVPRKNQAAFAAGMIAGINRDKEPDIVQAGPMEVSQYGKSLRSNGKGRKRR
jgi:hypothetical protein